MVFAQSHLAVLAVGHPLAPSVSSSLASSLASSTGSGGSSPTALPALSARPHPLDPSGSAGEGVPGKPGALLVGGLLGVAGRLSRTVLPFRAEHKKNGK